MYEIQFFPKEISMKLENNLILNFEKVKVMTDDEIKV